jgi:hypothetical protein
LLDHELLRARRAVAYLREGAPALQSKKLGSCLVENRLSTSVAKLAVLKTVKEWILKGFVAGPFKEPPVDNFRVNGMIAIIKGKRYFFSLFFTSIIQTSDFLFSFSPIRETSFVFFPFFYPNSYLFIYLTNFLFSPHTQKKYEHNRIK